MKSRPHPPPEVINPQTVGINRTVNLGLGLASERQTTRINPMSNIAPHLRNMIQNVEPLPTEKPESIHKNKPTHLTPYIRRVMRRPENDHLFEVKRTLPTSRTSVPRGP